MRRMVLFGALVAAMVVAAGVLGTGKAFAYGKGTVAQVEISGNCTNNSWCTQNFGGTGGFWMWAALNPDGTVDATEAGCGHTVGGIGGPGGAGGGGGPVDGSWTIVDNVLDTLGPPYFAFPVALIMSNPTTPDLTVPYYVISLEDGSAWAVPARQGHYNYSGVQFINNVPIGMHIPGVNFQTTVAP
jgi:hypothetical protein